MKVIAFNSSPNMDKGKTSLILKPFLEGMEEAKAGVELFYTRKIKINICTGEINCWFKNPGRCYQKDDMNILYPKLREADILVFASPIYWDNINGPMKNLIDRMALPLNGIAYEIRNGHSRLNLPKEFKPKKVVLVSSCGLWEMDNFDPALAYFKAFCRTANYEFAGALLRPHANALTRLSNTMESDTGIPDIFEAAKEAGRQLVNHGKVAGEIFNTISKELIPLEDYINSMNQYFQQAAAEAKK